MEIKILPPPSFYQPSLFEKLETMGRIFFFFFLVDWGVGVRE